jgi:hypothetical protein
MTLFTIRETDRPGNRFSFSTICLRDGMIGGAGFFVSEERARAVVTDAYKTPLEEVSGIVYGCQVRHFKALLQREVGALA